MRLVLGDDTAREISQAYRDRLDGQWAYMRQLVDFILCNNDLNRKSFIQAMIYWFNMSKGLDVIVWRLETFGFLYSPILNDEDKVKLNQYL